MAIKKKSVKATKRPKNGIKPTSPGEMLKEEWLIPVGITAMLTRMQAHVPPLDLQTVYDILSGKQRITEEIGTALYYGTGASSQFWLNLQKAYDEARKSK